MTEQKRIKSLFEKLFDGIPWIDVNLISTLKKISAKQASEKILPNSNSIWEITDHLINWRLNVLRRLKDEEIIYHENNYFDNIKDTSQKAWKNTLKNLEASQKLWLEYLDRIKANEFDKINKRNKMTYYEHIHGIIQHDAYHLGQIVILTKKLQNKR